MAAVRRPGPPQAMNEIKQLFQLDPGIVFLNHGSFGACPRPVFKAYQGWQRRMEREPVLFLGRELAALQLQARQGLGSYLNAEPDDLVFVPNATHGVNIVARSLPLSPGDEILTTDHEYGACDNIWNFICEKTGAKVIRQPFHLPIGLPEAFLESFWQGVTSRTKLIFISHISFAHRPAFSCRSHLLPRPPLRNPDPGRRRARSRAGFTGFKSGWGGLLHRKLPQMDAQPEGSRLSLRPQRSPATGSNLWSSVGGSARMKRRRRIAFY